MDLNEHWYQGEMVWTNELGLLDMLVNEAGLMMLEELCWVKMKRLGALQTPGR